MDEMKLKKLKSRWRRFIGQKTRTGNPGWVELLNSNWIGWAHAVMEKTEFGIVHCNTQRDVYHYFNEAIHAATYKDLLKLNSLYCQDYLIKKVR